LFIIKKTLFISLTQ